MGEHDGRSHDGTGQAPPARLIDTRYLDVTLVEDFSLEDQVGKFTPA
jgi:hypothetical protein